MCIWKDDDIDSDSCSGPTGAGGSDIGNISI